MIAFFRGICGDRPAFAASRGPAVWRVLSPRRRRALEEILGFPDPRGLERPDNLEKFGIEDQLEFARLVSVRPGAAFRRGSRVGQGT